MSFGTAVSTCLRKYGDFSGRATRSEYWGFYAFNVLVVGVPSIVGAILMAAGFAPDGDFSWLETGEGGPNAAFWIGTVVLGIAFVIALALVVPNYSVGCRRLHDKDASGWLQLIALVPFGGVVLLVFFLLQGDAADNQYGPITN